MLKPPQIVRLRQHNQDAIGRNPWRRLGLGLGMVVSLGLVLGILAGLAAYVNLTASLPSLESIPARLEPPNGTWLQPTRLYDRSGQQVILTLQAPGAAGWHYLTVSETGEQSNSFADSIVQATVAAIDPTYWVNPGYTLKNIWGSDQPTLTQQLVLDMLLVDEAPSLRRNIRQRLLAGQLISRYGHAKVIEWYLNGAQFGPLIYGADAAARVYFDKSASHLSVAEAAWLTAAAETPSIDPMAALTPVLVRQREIITQMLVQGLITADEARLAAEQALEYRVQIKPDQHFQQFTDLVLEQIGAVLPGTQIERGGMRIITTLDYDLQLQTQCVLETQLARLQGGVEAVLASDGTTCDAARLLTTLYFNQSNNFEQVSASVAVLDTDTGQVLALSGMDEVRQSAHPAGTLLTPFIYLPAFVRGFSPATLLWDVPQAEQFTAAVGSTNGLDELPGQGVEYHGPVRLRTALANDYLGAAAQLYERIGAGNTWQTAWQFGMTSLGEHPVGTGDFADFLETQVTLLESVHAFSVFSNLGLQSGQNFSGSNPNGGSESLMPVAVLRVEDNTGRTLLDWSSPQTRPIVNPQLAYLVTNVLSDESARWSSLGHPNPLEIGRPAGTRLGVSLDRSQVWTVGYVPQVVAGVWIGTEDGSAATIPVNAAAALWNAVIKTATQDLAVEGWSPPAGITSRTVCDPSGLLPTNECPSIVNEVFLSGNEPTQEDNLYQELRINRETGQLATIFTPAELVDARVFLVVPAWAEPWAEKAGLPIPPKEYDPIYRSQPASAEAQLTSPVMFAHVYGQVDLWGSAGGNDFSYYRLQVGQGLNPEEWLLVGEDQHQPVRDDLLGSWNTEGLQGLYVVQLLVVRADQRVENSVLQVTVDNTPPEVGIWDPMDGETFDSESGGTILLQASASDDLVLERLEFYLDGELDITLWQPPYAIMWTSEPGEHTLLVRAYDLAGNFSEQVVEFEVRQ